MIHTKVLRFPILFLILFSPAIQAQTGSPDWQALRAAETGKSPFISRIIEYKPAPGQFINQEGIGTPEAAESIVGGLDGLVSLGGFGGYIVLGFDHQILNDPDNPYGVDFTVAGNATPNHSEPGIVMVMCETGCGEHNGVWYELKGSAYDLPATIRNYTITYRNPKSEAAADVEWSDSEGQISALKKVSAHGQPYYPLPEIFTGYPQDEVSFTGTLIGHDINDDNPQFIRITAQSYGYADNLPFTGSKPPFLPDNPHTVGVTEGDGGDAFDIDWAVDGEGRPVHLDAIDFIKIYTAVNANAGWLGEISTEVRAVIDVSPDDVLSQPEWIKMPGITVFPNPASHYVNIQIDDNASVARIEIWSTTGQLFYSNTAIANRLVTVPVKGYPSGMYIVCAYDNTRRVVKKIVVGE